MITILRLAQRFQTCRMRCQQVEGRVVNSHTFIERSIKNRTDTRVAYRFHLNDIRVRSVANLYRTDTEVWLKDVQTRGFCVKAQLIRFSVLNQVKHIGNHKVLKLQQMNAYLIAINPLLRFPHVYHLWDRFFALETRPDERPISSRQGGYGTIVLH